ncbi:MAG: hypothetical protein PF484_11895 [Bacteroidales bacterium]|jgi:hypothetical protein|nr:hypothetical protein [Bacteroidales bacterium]
MSRAIIDLIQENKRRFYKGEIRNCFYEEPYSPSERKENSTLRVKATTITEPVSMWHNLKTFGQKFRENLFYEPAK